MSCASRRVKVMFILGCGSSRENAIISGLLPNLLAIRSNGGASATCLPWFGSMAWQEAQRACAKRFPLSESAVAAKDADTSSSNGNRKHKELSCPFLGDLLRELHPLHINRISFLHQVGLNATSALRVWGRLNSFGILTICRRHRLGL